MVMSNCPHCGKPLRPGSRFCGNCGNTVESPVAERPPGLAAAGTGEAGGEVRADETSQAGWLPCPHCGKPVRPGAKFCHNCGRAISVEESAGPSAVPEPSGIEVTAPVAQMEGHAQSETRTTTPEQKRRKNRSAVPMVIAGLLLACVAAITGGYLYLRDPFNWFSAGPLAMQTASLPSASPASPTLAPSPNPTGVPATATLVPTTALAASSTSTISPPATLTPTATPAQPQVLLLEDFDGALNEQWVVWLEPESPDRPKISTGPGEKFLELMAIQVPGEAGVTTRDEIPITAGLDIQFIGQLKVDLPGHVIMLDWDPIDVERGPLSTQPGEIHLEIWRDKIIFGTTSGELEACQSPITGFDEHSYRIFIESNQDMSLYVDGSQNPLCVLKPVLTQPEPGFLTFTGAGWITKIQVTAPAE